MIWIGYNFDDETQKWQMVNGTTMDLNYHYFGLKGSNERKRRSLDQIVIEGDDMTITIDNTGIENAEDVR